MEGFGCSDTKGFCRLKMKGFRRPNTKGDAVVYGADGRFRTKLSPHPTFFVDGELGPRFFEIAKDNVCRTTFAVPFPEIRFARRSLLANISPWSWRWIRHRATSAQESRRSRLTGRLPTSWFLGEFGKI
jgi:hypothetical protein